MLSLSSPLQRLAARLSGTGSASKTESSNTSAATSTASTPSGPCLSITGPATCLPAISSLPETRRLVITQALNDLFNKQYFDICKVDALIKVIHGSERSEAYALLRTLHCVHYSAMSPSLRDCIPLLVNECLTDQPAPAHVATDLAMHGLNL